MDTICGSLACGCWLGLANGRKTRDPEGEARGGRPFIPADTSLPGHQLAAALSRRPWRWSVDPLHVAFPVDSGHSLLSLTPLAYGL